MTVALALLYTATGTFALLSRLRFERRRRLMTQVQAVLASSSGAMTLTRRHAAAAELLDAAPVSLLWTLAGDSSLPLAVQPPVATALARREGIERLRRRARHGRSWRRVAALRALVLSDPAPAWSLLAAALHDAAPDVRAATVTLLGQIDHRCAAELLADALRLGQGARSRIATALEGFPRGVPDVIAPLLWSDSPEVRFWATTLMRRYPSHPDLFARLETLTGDGHPLVRKAALETLADVGDPRGAAIAARALDDDVFFVRAHAARALAALGGIRDAGRVGRMLADRDWWVRFAARQSLESLGAEASPSVIPFLVHPDLFARNGAAEVLQNTGVYARLLQEEATGRTDRYRRDVLLLLAEAGGRRMWNGQMARLAAVVHVRPTVGASSSTAR